jgi:hypothetical protein
MVVGFTSNPMGQEHTKQIGLGVETSSRIAVLYEMKKGFTITSEKMENPSNLAQMHTLGISEKEQQSLGDSMVIAAT